MPKSKKIPKIKIPKIKVPNMEQDTPQKGGFFGMFDYLHNHILYLNNSKFFAGIIMIMLNVGSKFISIQFSKSTEEYLKYSITKQILVFSMAWMGTRDIYTSLFLTAVFVVLSDHLFNEESKLCIVPKKYRVLDKLKLAVDENADGKVSDADIAQATAVLEKARREKEMNNKKDALLKFDLTKY